MAHFETKDIKNIVLVGASRSGKTTLAECMMFEGGVINRMGNVDDRNTVSDYQEVEQQRGGSVFSSIMHTEWRGAKINILDTPGFDDFIGEVIPALRVADTALLLLNAQHGVEVGTEIVMRYLRKYNKPTIMVVNQIDHPKSDFDQTVEQVRSQFDENVVVVQYPYNQGDGFNAIIDLLKMTMYKFSPQGGKPEKLPIPPEERAKADELHNRLVEAAAENDETLMEHYFEKGELDEDEMREGLRLGMLKRSVVPLFCLAAKRDMGSGRLMGFIGNVCPTAADMPPESSADGKAIATTDKTTTLFVFKAATEKHAGAMSFFKVCSGEAVAGMELVNTSANVKGKLNQLFSVDGKNRHAVERLAAGDIGATVKFKDTLVNHTLRSADDGVEVAPIVFPEPRTRMAAVPAKQGEEEKLAVALHRLHENDPTLIVEHSQELKQMIVYAQGDIHLQTVKWLLQHQHGVEVEYKDPRISYRETIRTESNADYRHKKQSGGAGQFGEVHLRIMPYDPNTFRDPTDVKIRERQEIDLPAGGKLLFANAIVGGTIDSRFMPAILKGVMEVMEEGPLTGSPSRDIAVVVYDGKMHPVDSNEISFKIAGKAAFKEAFLKSRPMLMEPILHLEVLTPNDYTGDLMTDLQSRRAIVEGMDTEGNYQKIVARVPQAEMHRYNTALNSLTQGRATYTLRFQEYVQVPPDVQDKLVKAHQPRAEAE